MAPYLASYLRVDPYVINHEELARVPAHVPGFDALARGSALAWLLRRWHVHYLGGEAPRQYFMSASFAWVTRLLSIVNWSIQPRVDQSWERYRSDAPPALPNLDARRIVGRCVFAGGGNLHALICLAWYVVVDAARELLGAYERCPERLEGERGSLAVDRGLRAALAGLGPVPAYPLAAWYRAPFPQTAPFPELLWRQRRAAQHAQGLVRTLRSLYALCGGTTSNRARRPSLIRGRIATREWDDRLRRNVHVYSDACRRLLGSAVGATRLLGHIVYRTYLCYRHGELWDPRDPPVAYLSTLKALATAPIERIHTLPDELAEDAMLPRWLVWELEAIFDRHAAALAPSAVHHFWGVPPDRPDSMDRVGALCPAGSYYLRIPIVTPDVMAGVTQPEVSVDPNGADDAG